MSKINSRSKGQRAERLAIRLLQPVVTRVYESRGLEPPVLERNLMQSMKGGFDIVGLEWMALEIKHHETLQINRWWEQTLRQSGKSRVPVLMYKQNRVAWRVVMFGRLNIGKNGGSFRAPVDIALPDFLGYFEERLKYQIEREKR